METDLGDLIAQLKDIDQQRQKKIEQIEKKLQSLPVDENLLFFYGESCPFTTRVLPEVRCLETSLGKQISRKEIWSDSSNRELYRNSGGQQNCGGVPYFYNKLTGKSVCGASSCDDLISWAKSSTNA